MKAPKVKPSRIDIRLTKAKKDAILSEAQKHGLDITNYILKMCLPKSK